MEAFDIREIERKIQDTRNRNSQFLETVYKGIAGHNKGLVTGNPRFDKRMGGILPSRYYLIGANSGVGKTTFADMVGLYYPFLYYNLLGKQDRKIKVIYFSFEIGKMAKMAQAMGLLLNVFYGYDLGINDIFSMQSDTDSDDSLLNPEILGMIEDKVGILNHLFEEYADFYDEPMTAQNMGDTIMQYALDNGEFKTVNGKKVYIPDEPDEKVIVITDSLNLIMKDVPNGQYSSKDCMDAYSAACVHFRNQLGYTFINIQQFNNNITSVHRQQLTGRGNGNPSGLKPNKTDFGDSTYTFRDADVVIGGISPKEYDIPQYLGYDITNNGRDILGNKATFWHIAKDRWTGNNNIVYPMIRTNKVPIIREMPKPDELPNWEKLLKPVQLFNHE